MAQLVSDKRVHPRIDLTGSNSHFLLDPGYLKCRAADVSKGGICFVSDRGMKPGQRLKLNAQNVLGVEIEIAHCEMFMSDDTFMEASYRIGAKFASGPIHDEELAIVLESLKP